MNTGTSRGIWEVISQLESFFAFILKKDQVGTMIMIPTSVHILELLDEI